MRLTELLLRFTRLWRLPSNIDSRSFRFSLLSFGLLLGEVPSIKMLQVMYDLFCFVPTLPVLICLIRQRTAVFIGFSLLKTFYRGQWAKSKRIGRILAPTIGRLQLPCKDFNKQDNNGLLALQQDLAFVPLTLAAAEIAQGNLNQALGQITEAIRLISHCGFNADLVVFVLSLTFIPTCVRLRMATTDTQLKPMLPSCSSLM